MSSESHWQDIYRHKSAKSVSWYRPHLDQSLALIAQCKLPASAHIVDVGGGASSLVDDLLQQGYTQLTVIDLAESALDQARARLAQRAQNVRWVCGDATTPLLHADSVDLWHDRAMFHFLTDETRRSAYIEQVTRCVRPGGYVIVGTFALNGPERCSGLPVVRYSTQGLADLLSESFDNLAQTYEQHVTPAGTQQPFAYVLGRRRSR